MKIEKVGIIGCGYVGKSLAERLIVHYDVVCYEIDSQRVDEINKDKTLNLFLTSDAEQLRYCDVYIITVQTPLEAGNIPDYSFLVGATELVATYLNIGNLIIYESTVAPGTTENMCLHIIERVSKLKVDKDFLLAYSPERINPSDNIHTLDNTVKIVSGHNEEALFAAYELYHTFLEDKIFKVDSIMVAEAAKLLENLQRDTNIALINEYAQTMNACNIDMKKVLDAAKSKWNFAYYHPGLVGGHCIGVDSYYYIEFAKKIGFSPLIVETARRVNDELISFLVHRLIDMLNDCIEDLSTARVGILGVSYKKNVSDFRNSATVKIINLLKNTGCQIMVFDPLVNEAEFKKIVGLSLSNYEDLSELDSLICLVYHDVYENYIWDCSLFNNRHQPIVIDLHRDLSKLQASYWLL